MFRELWNTLCDWVKDAWNRLKNFFMKIWDELVSWWEVLCEEIDNWFSNDNGEVVIVDPGYDLDGGKTMKDWLDKYYPEKQSWKEYRDNAMTTLKFNKYGELESVGMLCAKNVQNVSDIERDIRNKGVLRFKN